MQGLASKNGNIMKHLCYDLQDRRDCGAVQRIEAMTGEYIEAFWRTKGKKKYWDEVAVWRCSLGFGTMDPKANKFGII